VALLAWHAEQEGRSADVFLMEKRAGRRYPNPSPDIPMGEGLSRTDITGLLANWTHRA
jgi:hypothetical protein